MWFKPSMVLAHLTPLFLLMVNSYRKWRNRNTWEYCLIVNCSGDLRWIVYVKGFLLFVFVLFSPQVFNYRHFKDAYGITNFLTVQLWSSGLGASSAEVSGCSSPTFANRAIRLTKSLRKFDHVSTHRNNLNWLPISHKIKFRSIYAVLCYYRQDTGCLLLDPPI